MPATRDSCSEIDSPRKSELSSPGVRGAVSAAERVREPLTIRLKREGRLHTDGPPVSYLHFHLPVFCRRVLSSFEACESGRHNVVPVTFGQWYRPVRTGLARPFGRRATGRPAPGAAFSFGRDLPGVRWPDNRQKVLLNCLLQFGRLGPKVAADKMWITSKRSFRRNPAIIRFFARTKEQYSCRCPS